jgi:CRP-like cAMP-binding protein
MLIIGCDYHPSFQQIAFVDTDTGELQERRLEHREEAEKFYRGLGVQGMKVRVGMEASGQARWFERLLGELHFELWIGDATEIARKRERKQKTDRQDALAEEIANLGSLMEVSDGSTIIEQGAEDNDVYLIIAGAFDILVNGRKVARRFADDHIGEMAAIQPTQRRSATNIATEKSVLCKLTEPQLSEIGRKYPDIWRLIAKELARRLEQRNAHVTATHEKFAFLLFPPLRLWRSHVRSRTLLNTTSSWSCGPMAYSSPPGIRSRVWSVSSINPILRLPLHSQMTSR